MAKKVNLSEAKVHLSRLVEEAARGREIVITKAGKPMARLVALAPAPRPKTFGLLEGQIKVPEDFNAPLDPQTWKTFTGE